MTPQQYQKAGGLFNKITQKKGELELVEHLVSNIQGSTAKVRINSGWTVELPVIALRGHAQARKIQLEQELKTLEDELRLI